MSTRKLYISGLSNEEHNIEEVKEAMITTNLTRFLSKSGIVLFTSLCLCLLLSIVPARAVTCPVPNDGLDGDNDGYTDFMECEGLIAAEPTVFLQADFPGRSNCPTVRENCLDPDSPDVFAIFLPAATSLLADLGFSGNTSDMFNPFDYVEKDKELGGLGITVHVIGMTDLDPAVTDSSKTANYRKIIERTISGGYTIWQKAVTITEDATSPLYDSSGEIQALGSSSWGTPNGQDNININTGRIQEHILELCGDDYEANADTCADQTGATGVELFKNMARNTMAHEFGHDVGLRDESVDRYDGHHYSSKDGSIMRQFNKVVTRKGALWDLPQVYDPADQGIFSLTYIN